MGPQKTKHNRFLKAISRSRAAQQYADKRLGGGPSNKAAISLGKQRNEHLS